MGKLLYLRRPEPPPQSADVAASTAVVTAVDGVVRFETDERGQRREVWLSPADARGAAVIVRASRGRVAETYACALEIAADVAERQAERA